MMFRKILLAASLALTLSPSSVLASDTKALENSLETLNDLLALTDRSIFLKEVINCSVWSSPYPEGMFESGDFRKDAIGFLAFGDLRELTGNNALRGLTASANKFVYNKDSCMDTLSAYYASSLREVQQLEKDLKGHK